MGALLCPLGLHALRGLRAAGRVRGVRVLGSGLGGHVGRGVALPRFVPLPSLGRQQSGCHWRRSVHGGRGPPYHLGSCSPAFTGRDLCNVLARWRGLACSPRPLWQPAAGAGGRVALRLRKDAVYADPSWVKGVTAGYMLGPEETQDRKGHCPMMVTVDVKVGEPGDEQEDEQGSDEEGASLLRMVKCPEEGDERWQQWGQRVHAKMRQWKHVHQAMRRAARICGFTKQGKESQAQPKLQRLVATLRKRQHEEVEARARDKGAEWQTEVTQAKKKVQTARRAVEEEQKRIYQKVLAEHERYMERAVPYKSLRYIRELAEAGKPQEIRAVRLQCGRVTGNKKEVLEEVAQSFRRQHN